MSSRNTRKRLKDSSEKNNEEKSSNEIDVAAVDRRKSLRHHSSSSSISPPSKTRKIHDDLSPNKKDTTPNKTAKNSKTPKISPKLINKNEVIEKFEKKSGKSCTISPENNSSQVTDDDLSPNKKDTTPNKTAKNSKTPKISPKLINKNEVIDKSEKKSGKSCTISPENNSSRVTRNSSISPQSSTKTISTNPAAGTSQLVNENSSPVLRRSTRGKTSPSPSTTIVEIDNDVKNEMPRTRRGRLSTSNTPVKADTSQPLSNKKSPKDKLLTVESTNGTSVKMPTRSSKRKCNSIDSDENKPNGSNIDSSCSPKEKKIKKQTEKNETLSNSVDNCISNTVNESNNRQNNGSKNIDKMLSVKRKLVDDQSLNESNKKNKISDIIKEESIIAVSSENKVDSTTSINSVCKENDKCIDMLSNVELLLTNEFGLTEAQLSELNNIISDDIRDSNDIAIVEELITKLLVDSPTSITSMSSPRYNKFLRQLLMKYCSSETSVEKKHQLCESALEWSQKRKSVNLRHELELALMTLYFDTKYYRKAEETASGLYKETKKLQDKEKTVKACLCLSKCFHAMGNIAKARANITTAKTEALKIYTPPDLQAELDLQSGILQVAEEKDMETAFSYFKEAATGSTIPANRSRALKYMLLTKLLVNRPEDGEKAVRSQTHAGDVDLGVEAMLSITKAAVSASLADFKKARDQYNLELEEDLVVRGVLDQLYSKMLEKNLLSIIAPYERLQLSVISERMGLDRMEIERRLSQMILDGQLSAQLDHRDDCLYVYASDDKDVVYKAGLESITQLDRTLSLLNRRVKKLL